MRRQKWLTLLLLALFTTASCLLFSPVRATAENNLFAKKNQEITPIQVNKSTLALGFSQSFSNEIESAQKAYQAGRYTEAVEILEQALTTHQDETLTRAAILSNLALAYQKLGEWDRVANLVTESTTILEQLPNNPATQKVIAPTLDIKGRLELVRGEGEQALTTWQQTASIYQQLDDERGLVRSQINQAQALQTLGFYRRATQMLTDLNQTLQEQPDSLIKAVGLRSLGNSLQSVGDLEQAQQVLSTSLEISQKLQSPEHISAALFSLGNVARAQQKDTEAMGYYQQIVTTATSSEQQTKAQLNYLSLLIKTEQWDKIPPLLSQIETQLDKATVNRPSVYARINYAQSLTKLAYQTKSPQIKAILTTAVKQARQLEDKPTESYALGNLGRLYELEQQWIEAQKLTQQALAIAQEVNASYIAYQWQWQLGRILKAQNQEQEATYAYGQAVYTLQSLRSDLVTVNPEVRFSFRESVEPVYREYVNLLLQEKDNSKPKVQDLTAARKALDSLQLAELENFFRATCLDAQPVLLDRITDRDDPNAAVIYPIALPDRFEIILKLPQQELRHYTVPVEDARKRDRILQRFTQILTLPRSSETLPLAQQIYDWLIRPAAEDLANSNVKTLVFVLDSSLRNVPMSALHDGEQYLIEKYAVALAPGLQLVQPQPIAQQQLKALTAGLTEARDGFPALKYVAEELKTIQSEISDTDVLLDSNFVSSNLQEKISALDFPIVHLATHGQFSSQAEETFILAWDKRININQLRNLLQNQDRPQDLELLVLSACETLTGDKRAALGLAGMAVRAGARSTLGSLWKVNDEATSLLMSNFYQQLAQLNSTKAEALRKAQLSLLKEARFDSPYFWASFVLLGNWL